LRGRPGRQRRRRSGPSREQPQLPKKQKGAALTRPFVVEQRGASADDCEQLLTVACELKEVRRRVSAIARELQRAPWPEYRGESAECGALPGT
jgi:hypothetical protein